MNLGINFSSSVYFPLLLAILAIAFTFFIYRYTTPSVPAWVRRTLAALRTIALAAAVLLLFEPVISIGMNKSERPAVALLLDRSASMTLADSALQRQDIVEQIVSQPWLDNLRDQAEVAVFTFSDSLQKIPLDSVAAVEFNGDGSDLSAALRVLKEEMANKIFRGVVLLTDGAYNIGGNPLRTAENYAVPLIIPQIGTSVSMPDVKVSDVVTNEIAYANTKLPVEVTISATGYSGRRAILRIFEGDRQIASEEVTLPADNAQIETNFDIIPKTLGLNRYVVELEHLDHEMTLENNRRVFYVKVLKSKVRLWVFAGAPSADFAFLQRALDSDSNFVVTGLIQRRDGSFYSTRSQPLPSFRSAQAWQQVDGVIMVDFPRANTDQNVLAEIKTQLLDQGKPLFYLHGPKVDLTRLWQMRQAIPIQRPPAVINEKLVSISLLPASYSNPVTRSLLEQGNEGGPLRAPALESVKDDLPPLFLNLSQLQPLAGSQTLISVHGSSAASQRAASPQAEPAWISYKTAARKTFAVFTYGLWRWKMLLEAVNKSGEFYDNLVRKIVRWMVTKDDSKLVRIISNKEIYRGGERIELIAQVYHEDYQPMEGAEVRVKLSGPNMSRDLILRDVGNGMYRDQVQVLAGGEYRYEGTAERSGQSIGEDRGRFSVEPFNLEFLNTDVNEELLREIASVTGGHYGPPSELQSYLDQLPLEPLVKRENRDWALWGRPGLLLALVVTLSVEWLIRRRQGML